MLALEKARAGVLRVRRFDLRYRRHLFLAQVERPTQHRELVIDRGGFRAFGCPLRRVGDHGVVGDIARLAIGTEETAQMPERELCALQAPAPTRDVIGFHHREQAIQRRPLDLRADRLSRLRFAVALLEEPHRVGMIGAIDWVYPEWNRKAIAFVSFGGVGGARSVQQLRETAIELQLAPIRSSVHIPVATLMAHFQGGDVDKGLAELEAPAKVMIDDLLWWTTALKTARKA
jgi:hypothetical protein